MADAPNVHELARDLARLEADQRADRADLKAEIATGFAELKSAIAGLDFVSRDVYAADMRRLEQDVNTLREQVKNAMRVFTGGFLVVIAIGAWSAGVFA